MNPDIFAFQRKFVTEVSRCDNMERSLRYLEIEMKREQLLLADTGEHVDAAEPRDMINLEATFEKLENELREVNQNAGALKKNLMELTELKHVLLEAQVFFAEVIFYFFLQTVFLSSVSRLSVEISQLIQVVNVGFKFRFQIIEIYCAGLSM